MVGVSVKYAEIRLVSEGRHARFARGADECVRSYISCIKCSRVRKLTTGPVETANPKSSNVLWILGALSSVPSLDFLDWEVSCVDDRVIVCPDCIQWLRTGRPSSELKKAPRPTNGK